MTQILKALAACAMTWPLVLGAQEPAAPASEHEQHAAPAAEATTGGHSMAAMHEHMRAMREQMARIQATESSAERQRLMNEHMLSMQQHMQMMGAMQGQGPAPGASRCAEGEAPALSR